MTRREFVDLTNILNSKKLAELLGNEDDDINSIHEE